MAKEQIDTAIAAAGFADIRIVHRNAGREYIRHWVPGRGVAIELDKVTGMAAILGYGVMSTPGAVIDGKVVHAGGVPDRKKIEDWLTF